MVVKGDTTNAVDFISDAINSIKPPKTMHKWEQSTLKLNMLFQD